METLLDFQVLCLEAHDGVIDLECGCEDIQVHATVYSEKACEQFRTGKKYRVMVVEA